jgi:hypothetical protein
LRARCHRASPATRVTPDVVRYTGFMKRRRGLWILIGMACLLAVGVGWLAWPEDELSAMMRFHPRVRIYDPPGWPPHVAVTEHLFFASPAAVLASIPRSKLIQDPHAPRYLIDLPSGQQASFWRGESLVFGDGASCQVDTYPDERPWYQRSWATIKQRLGL